MHAMTRIQSEVSIKIFYVLMFLLLGIIMILRISDLMCCLIGGLAIYTVFMKRVELTFLVLMLLVSLAIMNPVFFNKGSTFYIMTRGSIMFLAVTMTVKSGLNRSIWFLSPFSLLFIYIGYIMLTSLAGWAPVISELKALLFLVFLAALIQSVSAVAQSRVEICLIRTAMLVLSCFFILGSLMTVPFPSIGRSMILQKAEVYGQILDLSNVSGLFNGVTWHSQTLGPTMAILNSYLLSDYFCNIKKTNWIYLVLLIAIPILVFMTSSRTAFFAYLISIFACLFFFMRERRVSDTKKTNVITSLIFLCLVAICFVMLRASSRESVEAFLRKTDDIHSIEPDESLRESLTKSRMGLVEQGLVNFRNSPMIGNGFQVSEDMTGYKVSEMGMVLTAPVEKGVLFVMVLEEGGIIGALILAAFMVVLYVKYMKLGFTCFLSTFTVFLGLNSGEASFFSTSGGGGILWLICFCSLLMDVHRHRRMLAEGTATNRR